MTAKELIEIGRSYERDRKIDEAVATYTRAISLWPQEIELYNRIAVIANKSRNPHKSLELTAKGLAIHDKVINLWGNRAIAFMELARARYDEASAAFDRVIALDSRKLGRIL